MEKIPDNFSTTSQQATPSFSASSRATTNSSRYRNSNYAASYQTNQSDPQQHQQSNRSYPQQQQQSNRSYPQQQQQSNRSYQLQQSNRSYSQRGAYAPQQPSSSFRNNSINSHRDQSSNANYAEEEKLRRENRSQRFENQRGNQARNNYTRPKTIGARLSAGSKSCEGGNNTVVKDIDLDSFTVKGTCQEVEKCYLRLTSAPDPATVRPEKVLEKALLMVQKSQKNYLYKCDQLKSIRQDLTVQRIRNELTVKVYETHARLAIEVGDLSEYNQCQSQLQELYAEGHKGCDMEFSAYNLLSVILHSNNNRDLLSAMSRLSVDARIDGAVKHALAVRQAVTFENYVLFFRLYKKAPNLNTFLMDLYVEKMRYTAVKCISRSYRPTLPVAYIAQLLGFSSVVLPTEPSDEKDTDGLEECAEWLKAHGACLIIDNAGKVLLDSKVFDDIQAGTLNCLEMSITRNAVCTLVSM
uniref:PCI domain-containing protein n=1 Tax=Daucus carota subsp. sativus TaxID=79200 RepID=A0A175YP22_DAUCS